MYIIESNMDIIAKNSPDLQKMVMSVVNQRQNQNSRQTYYTALTQFFNWYSAGDNQGITAEIIREYLIYLENRGKSKATISTSLSVLRQLFKDLRRLEVIDEKIYNDLLEIKFKKPLGQRHKTWLEQEEVQKLLNNFKNILPYSFARLSIIYASDRLLECLAINHKQLTTLYMISSIDI